MNKQDVLNHRLQLIREEAKHVIENAKVENRSIEEEIEAREEWHLNRKDISMRDKDLKLFRYSEMRNLMKSLDIDLNEVPKGIRVK